MKKFNITAQITTLLFFVLTFLNSVLSPVNADTTSGTPIKIGTIDELLWDVVATIQWYGLPTLALVIGALGFRLFTSGDNTTAKSDLLSHMIKIGIGGVLIWGCSMIAGVIKTHVSPQ